MQWLNGKKKIYINLFKNIFYYLFQFIQSVLTAIPATVARGRTNPLEIYLWSSINSQANS